MTKDMTYESAFEHSVSGLMKSLHIFGKPKETIQKCLETTREFYDCDCAAIVETNRQIGYAECVAESLANDFQSYIGRALDLNETNTPYLYQLAYKREVFSIVSPESIERFAPTEAWIMRRMGIQHLVVAPFLKRHTGYLYICNPRNHIDQYHLMEFISYACASESNEFFYLHKTSILDQCHDDLKPKEVRICVFGGLEIKTLSGTLTESEFSAPLCVKLIAYLLLHRNRYISQVELLDTLWPEDEKNVGTPTKQVRNVVHRTRKVFKDLLSESIVESDHHGRYFLNPDLLIRTDVGAFEDQLQRAQSPSVSESDKVCCLLHAIDLFSPEFLPQYTGDSWLDNLRTHYQMKYMEAVEMVLPLLYQRKCFNRMLDICNAALLMQPSNPDLLFWNIRALHRSAGILTARSFFHEHEEYLSAEQKILLHTLLSE